MNICINFDPVVSHLRMHHLAGRFRDNDIGLLNRHMTVNALILNLVTHCFGHAAGLPLMAGEALERIERGGLSGGVDVVAGRAAQLLRRSIAFASLQQADLIAMNIRKLHLRGWERLEVFAERLSRNVRESRR